MGKAAFLRVLSLELGRRALREGNIDAAAIGVNYRCDGVARVQAGSGIVADSNPAAEYEETRDKARALLQAIEMAETEL